MYKRDNIKNPQQCNRDKFISEVIYLNHHYGHTYDTALMSIKIGDDFCQCKKLGTIYINKDINLNYQVERIYSVELAHVSTIIAAKINEDHGYDSTSNAAKDLMNNFVIKLEWEICYLFNFTFKRSYLMSSIIDILRYADSKNTLYYELIYDINNLTLVTINNYSLSSIIVWLFKNKKLKAYHRVRELKFIKLVKIISNEYNVDIPDILNCIKKLHN